MFDYFLQALPLVFSLNVILAMIAGTVIGIAVGALPGLSATMGIAVLIPITFAMEPLTALGMIAGIYNGAMYGGAIPAILLRIPGTPAAIATVFDGYSMAQKGHARLALEISLVSSAIGGAISALALLLLAPPLAQIALKFGPADYFWLAIFGLTTVVMMLGENIAKGFLGTCIGLFFGMVGIDNLTGVERFTFDNVNLLGGFSIIVFLTGLYAIPPALDLMLSRGQTGRHIELDRAHETFRWRRLIPVWIRSGLIGMTAGVIPGMGGNIGAIIAWNEQRRIAPNKAEYGQGVPEGVAAPECANNADSGTSLVPALTLGVPGNSVAAVILGALLVHGMRPGPELFRANGTTVYGFMLAMLITCGILYVVGRFGARLYVRVLHMPQHLLGPMILALTIVGIYAIDNSLFDVCAMLGFGLLGYAMEKFAIPTAPAVLAIILGPMAEASFRRGLLISGGDWHYYFQGPIALVLIALILLMLSLPIVRNIRSMQGVRNALGVQTPPSDKDIQKQP